MLVFLRLLAAFFKRRPRTSLYAVKSCKLILKSQLNHNVCLLVLPECSFVYLYKFQALLLKAENVCMVCLLTWICPTEHAAVISFILTVGIVRILVMCFSIYRICSCLSVVLSSPNEVDAANVSSLQEKKLKPRNLLTCTQIE